MITFPNAKINLGLDIVNRRPDGYHDIATVMIPVPWLCDILEIVPSDSAALLVTGNAVDCPVERNLVWRAYQILEAPASQIFLHKLIPDGAGMGGGSADAAFTLKMLRDIYSPDVSDEDLAYIAAFLGADCPFFVYNRPMLAIGTGTTLLPIEVDLSGLWLAVVKPSVGVSTREAYAGVTPQEPREDITEIIKQPVSQWRGRLKNDFEPGIIARLPIIDQIKQYLYDIGAEYASMTGSGSAVYGLFATEPDKKALHDRWPGCWVGCGRAM